jgi:sec-independent protein translocase protein TatA
MPCGMVGLGVSSSEDNPRVTGKGKQMAPSWFQLLLVLLLVVLLFGRGKISEVMGDFAKGIKSFKKGLSDDDKADASEAESPKSIEGQVAGRVDTASRENVRAG